MTEKKFDIDNFEKFLREVTDEFCLYPSQRVWHSIYNNIHPGRRWPSVTAGLILFFGLMTLGYFNTKVTNTAIVGNDIATATPYVKNNSVNKQSTFNGTVTAPVIIASANLNTTNNTSLHNPITKAGIGINSATSLISEKKYNTRTIKSQSDNANHTLATEPNANVPAFAKYSDKKNNISGKNLTATGIADKTNNKLSLQVYAAPSLLVRNASDKTGTGEKASSDELASMGVEVGATMKYNLLKRLKLTTGLQLNYAKYSVDNYGSNLTDGSIPFAAKISDGNSNAFDFNNETYQISIPVGVEYKLLGKSALNWNIGATLQPTFVMGNNAHSLSADKQNMVKNGAMSNWNLNAGFETFISYKMSGITWQIGPQFRYQLLSTYSKRYSVVENLSAYGLKIGISKEIK